MSDPNVYELLRDQIEGGFDRMDRRISEVVEQQRITNGRVNEAHTKIAVHDTQMLAHTQRIDTLSSRSHETANKLQVFMAGGAAKSVRAMLARDFGLVFGTVTIVISALKFLKVLP